MRHTIDIAPTSVSHGAESRGAAPALLTARSAEETFSLREILPTARFFSGGDIGFASLAESAASCTSGQLVVYRIGQDCPSQLVADALARGAAGILTEQLLPCPLPQCIVGDVDRAAAKLKRETLGRPDRQLLTVGVVGSAGKTTTSLLVASLLRAGASRTAYQTDLGDCDGIVQSTPSAAAPSGQPLVEWLGEATDSGCQAAIIELADDQLRHGNYDAVEFDLLVVTGSMQYSTDLGPTALQCALDQLAPTGVVVAPADDARAMRIIRDAGARHLSYGVRKFADVNAKLIDQSGGISTLMVTCGDTTAAMETPLCGAAMAANHAAAAAVGALLDQPLASVVETLGNLRRVPGRGEAMHQYGQASVVIDAAGSPERAAAAMRSARAMRDGGRLWCVLAVDPSDAADWLPRYGNLLEGFADQPVLTCRREIKAEFLPAAHAVLDGVKKCAAIRLVADHERAVRWAVAQAGPRDTILVVGGTGHGSAQAQRTEIEKIRGWIELEREQQAEADQPGQHQPARPKTFKVVG